MLKSSDFVRGYTEKFKQKMCDFCYFDSLRKNYRNMYPDRTTFYLRQYQINKLNIWKKTEKQNKYEMNIYNYTRLYYPSDL